MSEAEYTPEFVQTLNAWEQDPPLRAEFVFDLPPGDRRKADKVGVLMYQAVLLRQEHPELEFSRIKAITFTMDVHRTGDELEKVAGHDLPQFRQAAARLDVFHVNLGPGQVLIITDELANASLSPTIATRLAAWALLRTELARSVAVSRLASAGLAVSQPGLAADWQALARTLWIEWFCGFHAEVEGLSSGMARQRLREALEQDPAALAQAQLRFAQDHDAGELLTRAAGCARGLCEAMAEVLGQLAAQRTALADLDPQLETLIRAQGLISLWEQLGSRLHATGMEPAHWDGPATWVALAEPARDWLARAGLHYDFEADAWQISSASAGETP